ncbi:MAG: JAB domain-containing protein [Nevskiales bacterium]
MHSAARSRSISSHRLSSTLPTLRESAESQFGPQVQGLAGEDLSNQWDATLFALRGRSYCREFMTRMHHPFGEVLGVLFLDAQHKALAYHTCFRGDRPSALSHLPGIAQTAQQLGAVCVILAYNMIFDPSATLPDVRRMHARMAEAGVELHDFLLISPGHTRSLLAPALI